VTARASSRAGAIASGLLVALLAVFHPDAARATQVNIHCSDGWQENWVYNEYPDGDVHRIRLQGTDRIRWNGASVGRQRLWRHLDRAGAASPPPFVMLEFDEETDCALVQAVRERMTRTLRCGEGRCGEHFTSTRPPPRLSEAEAERALAEAIADIEAAVADLERAAEEAVRAAGPR